MLNPNILQGKVRLTAMAAQFIRQALLVGLPVPLAISSRVVEALRPGTIIDHHDT